MHTQAQYNYPYAIAGSPAYQVRAACEALAEPHLQGAALLKAMVQALNTFEPSGDDSSCYDVPSGADVPSSTFDYQVTKADLAAMILQVQHVCRYRLS